MVSSKFDTGVEHLQPGDVPAPLNTLGPKLQSCRWKAVSSSIFSKQFRNQTVKDSGQCILLHTTFDSEELDSAGEYGGAKRSTASNTN